MIMKLSLLAPGSEGLAEISKRLPSLAEGVNISSLLGTVQDLIAEIERNRPDLAVAQLSSLSDAQLRQLELALLCSPATALVILSEEASSDFQIRAMRAGVREVLPARPVEGELERACTRQVERRLAQSQGARRGRVLAFLPAKGGSGSTFLATNLADTLAARGKRVALIDLNLHFGDAALFLSESQPSQTITDLARQAARLDATLLESSMHQLGPNLSVLAAPDTSEGAIDVGAQAVERIVALARSRFDFVILDMGRTIEAATIQGLDQADAIYITVQTTLPFIHDAKRLLSVLTGLGYSGEKLHVIVNRAEKGGEIASADVRQALGRPVDLEVPNSFAAVAHSVNRGVPIRKQAPRDPVARALGTFADQLAPRPRNMQRGWSLRSLFDRLRAQPTALEGTGLAR
jgi:pilus assembly protein CpaE